MGASELTSIRTPTERLAEARARFAESLDAAHVDATLGSVVLRADQVDTARRVRAMLHVDGGCLLADDVGTGKSYIALAIAREWKRPLVVLPASLRSTWETAFRRARVPCATATHESLSRGTLPVGPFDGVVVDESHRFRPTSNRHVALARVAWRSPLLLLSATPLQNRARELAAQIALFVGEHAYALAPAELTRWIVRASASVDQALPTAASPRWAQPDVDDGSILEALLALPPPPRAADAGDGGALVQISLVRAWSSSRAALRATIDRRRRSLIALEQCDADGRVPTRRELAAWQGTDAVQLGFPAMLAARTTERATAEERTRAIEAERRALDIVVRAIDHAGDPDAARVGALRDICRRHDGLAVLAFSEYASTVRAFFAAMRADTGVGMLTATEARIASGRLTRDDLLARFAPLAQGARVPHARERVSLLLATDLLSEGVNLQDAAVVVHLDLPWNPARLAQRLGRIRRPGGAREVTSYLMAPPARSALLLRAETGLRDKLAQAERTIGRGLEVLPALSAKAGHSQLTTSTTGLPGSASGLAIAELRGEIHRLLTRWRSTGADIPTERREPAVIPSERREPAVIPSERSEPAVIPSERSEPAVIPSERSESRDLHLHEPVIAAVRTNERGWIAVLEDGRLIASLAEPNRSVERADGVTDDTEALLRVLRLADGVERATTDIEALAARRAVERWITHDWARRSCGLATMDSPLRRRMLRRLESALGAVPRHRRRSALSLAALVRTALEGRLPLGVERALADLPDERVGESWLASVAALLQPTIGADSHRVARAHAPRPRAIILLGPD